MAAAFQRMSRVDLSRQLTRAQPDNDDRRRGYALVDVVDRSSYAAQHIPGSMNIPQGEERLFEARFDKDKTIIVYCASFDCPASGRVAKELTQRGFTTVYDYEGGLLDWKAGGKPVAH
jgi:rhodanese-related sulfurtransferase